MPEQPNLEAGIRSYPDKAELEQATREACRESTRWLLVDAIYGERTSLHEGGVIDDRFVRLVNGGRGIIDIQPSRSDKEIIVHCYFYNPGQGKETIKTLVSLLQDLANGFNMPVIHMAVPLHKHASELMRSFGYQTKDVSQSILQMRFSPYPNMPVQNPDLIKRVKEILDTKTN